MTTIAVALIAIGLLVTVAIFIRKPAEHRRAHVTVAELQARLADESGPEHARADEEEAAEETGAAAADFEPEAPEERGPIAPEEFGPGRADEQAPGEAAESAPSDADEPTPAHFGRHARPGIHKQATADAGQQAPGGAARSAGSDADESAPAEYSRSAKAPAGQERSDAGVRTPSAAAPDQEPVSGQPAPESSTGPSPSRSTEDDTHKPDAG
ncbi:hypothetical protein [Nocardia cyriacigeorgica]|uniref:hypothetical protein n=1 Tax=Nocardia cyriacigeorgica TaxID=135487 RepID=UPI0024917C5B|nr:hypothetical protein [Nocardia cyriacigeorgica]BDT88886.1 hypothetical protein FMUAM8_46500 [Nocardia cyriacigeorgica]